MTIASGLTMIPSLMIGITVVQLLMPEFGLAQIIFKLFLGTGLGMGISSCLFYFWRLLLPAQENGYLYLEMAIIVLMCLIILRRGVPSVISADRIKFKNNSILLLILIAALAALAIIAGMSFIAFQEANPHGAYDAWSIWNLHARMLFRGGELWQSGFSSHLYHADYPLLLPASIARVWYILQEETVRVSMLVPVVFVISLVGLLFSVLLITRSAIQGVLAVIVLTGTSWFIEVASFQYADVILAWYVLATGALLYLYWYSNGANKGLLILGGMAAGMASWTKNEGILFLAAVTMITFATFWFSNKSKRFYLTSNLLLIFGAGLLLPVGALVSFKIGLAPPNDLVSGQNIFWVMQSLTNVQRYVDVLKNISEVISNTWQTWMLIGLLLYLFGAGPDKRIFAERNGLRVSLSVFCVMLAGVAGIYVLSHWTPEIHIRTSAGRVLMQIFPLFLLNVFLICGDLGSILVLSKSSSKKEESYAAYH